MMGMAVRETVFHYCDVRFPCGRYFRKKALRTLRLHGNMRNTFFMSDAEEFDIEERQYNAGEQESPRCATCTAPRWVESTSSTWIASREARPSVYTKMELELFGK
jgi:NAD-dependent SIR2 family protein deacetylase